jgi:hypothetical protein
MKTKIQLIIVAFLLLISCSSNDNDIFAESFNGGVGVYTCGQVLRSDDIYIDGSDAKMHKNGKSFKFTDNTSFSCAQNIVVNGNDVYVLGGINWTSNVWKNGTVVNLEEGEKARVTDMAVVGNDVYVSGYVNKNLPISGDQPVAVLWKNGVEINLCKKNQKGQAYSVFASGTDIYVGGYEGYTATIWKNGTPIKLTNDSGSSSVNDVVVVGNDIYAVGEVGGIATFWKNGVGADLSDNTGQVYLNKIAVIGTDVYIGGEEYNVTHQRVAKMWKNGVATNLTDGTRRAFFSSMFVDTTNNVYMVTNEANEDGVISKIWKNGELMKIDNNKNHEFISDIFVVSN